MKKEIIKNNLRPKLPENIPKKFADLISSCWRKNPIDRPNFDQIIDQLISLLNFPTNYYEKQCRDFDHSIQQKILELIRDHSHNDLFQSSFDKSGNNPLNGNNIIILIKII